MVICGIGIMLLALVCGYGMALHFSGNIEKLEVKKLEDTARMIDKTIIRKLIFISRLIQRISISWNIFCVQEDK